MFYTVRAAILAFAFVVVPTYSWALTTAYIDTVDGAWGNVIPAPNPTVRITNGGQRLAWGNRFQGRKSSYIFGGIDNTGPHALGDSFDLGRFTHNNFTILGGGITAATLSVTITGRLVDGLASTIFSVTSVFDVMHDETRNNQAVCPYGDTPPCGDLITFLTNAAMSETIAFNGSNFLFEASGFIGAFTNGNSLFSDESLRNHAIMQGRLTEVPSPSPVPLPAALPLLAGSIGFVGWIKRRKRT